MADSPAPCFLGQAEAVIDAKQRLAIPAKFRNELGDTSENLKWACLPWPAGYLMLHPKDQFREMAQNLRNRIAPNEDESNLWSSVFGEAEWVEMDSSGRVVLPKRHLELTGIGNQVVVLGANHCLEIHDKNRRKINEPAAFSQLPSLVRRLEDQQRL